MNWTHELPKVPGWYWLRELVGVNDKLGEARVVKVHNTGGWLMIKNWVIASGWLKGAQFAGPIPEPDDPQPMTPEKLKTIIGSMPDMPLPDGCKEAP